MRAGLFNSLAARIRERRNRPYDFVVVDEAQDISVAQLRFLVVIAGQQRNGFFLATWVNGFSKPHSPGRNWA